MAKATPQQSHAVITHFINKYTDSVGYAPVLNRAKSRYGIDNMLIDYTPGQAKELIDYYIDHYATPTIDWFIYNYEKVDVAKQEFEQNKVASAKRRAATEQRLREWRERWTN